ncbi:MAG: lipopolysaccharide biosynthesis protein [Candidatus Marinimicrobia bacterium]|nr:lipopolysaccharide biosynthesis protein [Candidatus Neomarinimicrobiota bacterium]
MDEDLKIKKQFFKGSVWLFGSNVFARLFGFITTLVLAKVLMPEDFGVVGYGFLVVNSVALFKMMGFNTALIYQKEKTQEAASSLFWFLVLWSIFLYCLIFMVSPVIAGFFREQRLVHLVQVLGLSIIINSISSIPISLLEKDIHFKKRILPDVSKLIIYSVTTIFLAFKGFSYWSFIWGTLLADLAQLVFSFFLKPVKIALRVDFSLLREMFRFGKSIVGLSFLQFGVRNIDDFFIGRMLETASLGIYQFSYRIANVPATNITNVFGQILFPTFAKIAHDDAKLMNAFIKFFRYIVILTVPLTFYIVLIIPDFVQLYYEQWQKAILPIQLISYFGLLRAIGSGMGSVFYAKGKPHKLLPISAFQFIILALLLYPFIRWYGITGACIAINISMTYSIMATFLELHKMIKVPFPKIFTYLVIPIFLSVALFLGVHFFNDVLGFTGELEFYVKLVLFPVLIAAGYFLVIPDRKDIFRELMSMSK